MSSPQGTWHHAFLPWWFQLDDRLLKMSSFEAMFHIDFDGKCRVNGYDTLRGHAYTRASRARDNQQGYYRRESFKNPLWKVHQGKKWVV